MTPSHLMSFCNGAKQQPLEEQHLSVSSYIWVNSFVRRQRERGREVACFALLLQILRIRKVILGVALKDLELEDRHLREKGRQSYALCAYREFYWV